MKYASITLLSAMVFIYGAGTTLAQQIGNKPKSNLVKLIGAKNNLRSFRFCDADKSTRQCKSAKGLKAVGLGGAFIPLGLEVKGFRISNRKSVGNNVQFTSKFNTEVNGIAPKCKDSVSTINVSSGKLEFKGFYCNWLAIGNVVARVKLEVDRVDVKRKTFSGKYTLRLVGTGNMFGKGYFTAKAG